jgi:hypothetical protein
MLQVGAVGYAALDGIALLRSDHGPGTITNAGYLLTAVAVLPVTATVVELDRGRWGNAAFGIGCLLLAVVSFRMHQTLGALDV